MGKGPDGSKGPKGPIGDEGDFIFSSDAEIVKIYQSLPKKRLYVERIARELDYRMNFNRVLSEETLIKNPDFSREFTDYIVPKEPVITNLLNSILQYNKNSNSSYGKIVFNAIGREETIQEALAKNANMIYCDDGTKTCFKKWEVLGCYGERSFDYDLYRALKNPPTSPGTSSNNSSSNVTPTAKKASNASSSYETTCSKSQRDLYKDGQFNVGNNLQVNGNVYVDNDLFFPSKSKDGVRFVYENSKNKENKKKYGLITPTGTPISIETPTPTRQLSELPPRYQEMISTDGNRLSLFADQTWKNTVTMKGDVSVNGYIHTKDLYITDDWHLYENENSELIIEYVGSGKENKYVKIKPSGKIYIKNQGGTEGEDFLQSSIKTKFPLN